MHASEIHLHCCRDSVHTAFEIHIPSFLRAFIGAFFRRSIHPSNLSSVAFFFISPQLEFLVDNLLFGILEFASLLCYSLTLVSRMVPQPSTHRGNLRTSSRSLHLFLFLTTLRPAIDGKRGDTQGDESSPPIHFYHTVGHCTRPFFY